MNKKGLSNVLIEDLMKNLDKNPHYLGVFPVTVILKKKFHTRPRFNLILNTGGHFVCIHAEESFVFYIDSLGMIPLAVTNQLEQFLTKCKRPIFYNRRQVQAVESVYCGLYACLFTLYFGMPIFKEWKLVFYKNLKENDKLCLKYLKKMLDVL